MTEEAAKYASASEARIQSDLQAQQESMLEALGRQIREGRAVRVIAVVVNSKGLLELYADRAGTMPENVGLLHMAATSLTVGDDDRGFV